MSSPYPCPTLVKFGDASAVAKAMVDIATEMEEHLLAFHLTVRHTLIERHLVAKGSLTGVEVAPREVFKPAILNSTAALILAHNHPSGDPSPSRSDIELTTRLREVGELLGIPVLDHVIVARDGGFVSMAERGWR